jgi:CheY-like chemotaxis protein
VLVVDDDATFRRLARLVLATHGLVVVAEAGTVAEARSTAMRVKPDGALVDVELPSATERRPSSRRPISRGRRSQHGSALHSHARVAAVARLDDCGRSLVANHQE